jgi:hypothetical protein
VTTAEPPIELVASASDLSQTGQGQSLAEIAADAVASPSLSQIVALSGMQLATVRPARPQFPVLWSELRVETRYLRNAVSTSLRRAADLAVNGPLTDRIGIAWADGRGGYQTSPTSEAAARAALDGVQVLPDPRRHAELPLEWVNFTPRPSLATSLDTAISAALAVLNVPAGLRPVFASFVRYVVFHESGGVVNAVNRWDGNAIGAMQADGAPLQASRGWMQTIPQTFARFHAPGTSANIYEPIANICAALRYMVYRYGVNLSTGDGIQQFLARRVGGYVGY